MPQVQHGRYAVGAWLGWEVMNALANCLFFHLFPVCENFLLNEITESGDTL